MDVFRFVKLTPKANDPARRYAVVSGVNRVGDLEVLPPRDGAVVLVADLKADLSDAAREDALRTALRFLDELAPGWGVQLLDERREDEASPNGGVRSRFTFRTA